MWLTLFSLSAAPFLLVLIIYLIVRFIKPPLEFRYDDRPTLIFLYLKALYLGLHQKQGVFKDAKPLPERRLQVIVRDCRFDPGNLRGYAELCGYGKSKAKLDHIPTCYLESYFIPIMIVTATSEYFRLSPLGLIHISQTITQHTCLNHLYKEPFDVECSVLEYRPTEMGIEVDISMKAYDRREMCVWEGISTLLSHKKGTKRRHSQEPTENDINNDYLRKHEEIVLSLPCNLGIKFAWLSGDCRPQHMWSWMAKVLGYPQPTVQGMWTLSRCLAHLQTTGIFPLTPPFNVECKFKCPIFLPGESVFIFKPQPNKDVYWFGVEDKSTGVPQLQATVKRS